MGKISNRAVDTDDDDDAVQIVNPKRKRSQGGMMQILLELQSEEMKQNRLFFQNILAQLQQFQQ